MRARKPWTCLPWGPPPKSQDVVASSERPPDTSELPPDCAREGPCAPCRELDLGPLYTAGPQDDKTMHASPRADTDCPLI
eukprot:2327337-Pyramimonas_sp.AAC.1